MYAIIESGSKQYRVSVGDVIEVERTGGTGESIEFSRALPLCGDGAVRVGAPALGDAKVRGTALEEIRGPKIRVFKKKKRKQYRRTKGHRQPLLRVRIDGIG